MSHSRSSAGDTIPAECWVIEVRVAELRQLFNAIDPSPFRERLTNTMKAAFFPMCTLSTMAPR